MIPVKITSFIIVALFFWGYSGYGQQTDFRKEQQLEELVESLVDSEDASTESSLLLEDLNYYSNHPIYINKASEEELLRLNLLNFKQVQSILTYREKYGQLMTLKELSVLGNFSDELLQKIQPFILFDQERDSLQIKKDKDFRQSMIARIKGTYPISVGYESQHGKPAVYGGSPYSYYSRYRGEVGKWLEFGLTAENDAGEDFFRRTNNLGFDYMSGFISWKGKSLIKRVVLGDFHLRFGQGVSLWSGGGVSYASDLMSLMRSGEGIRPYSSTDENRFFRGAATQLDLRLLKLSLFFSDKRKDANIETNASGNDSITSFRLDGLHRTISEKEDEKNVNEILAGGYGDFRFKNWRFGMLASFQRFGLPVSKGNSLYKFKTFEGDVGMNFGLDYHLILNQISLFGEAGISQNLKSAVVNGLVWKAHQQFSLSFLYRFYDPAFQSFNTGAFAEGSGGRNESGLFTAFEFYPVAKVKIGGQADLFYFPWTTYQTISPSKGRAMAVQLEWALKSELLIYLHARFTQKPQKLSGVTGVPEQLDEVTSKWRLHCDLKISDLFQLRSRLESVVYEYNAQKEFGYLVFQDCIYSPSAKLKCWLRLAYYHTDGYNSRIYSYENDLLYYFAIPEFHGVGVRSYVNLKWQPKRMFTFYIKAGYTLREGAAEMGSGNDVTPGNYRMDIRSQMVLKF